MSNLTVEFQGIFVDTVSPGRRTGLVCRFKVVKDDWKATVDAQLEGQLGLLKWRFDEPIEEHLPPPDLADEIELGVRRETRLLLLRVQRVGPASEDATT